MAFLVGSLTANRQSQRLHGMCLLKHHRKPPPWHLRICLSGLPLSGMYIGILTKPIRRSWLDGTPPRTLYH